VLTDSVVGSVAEDVHDVVERVDAEDVRDSESIAPVDTTECIAPPGRKTASPTPTT
jgi:hypothetical protein